MKIILISCLLLALAFAEEDMRTYDEELPVEVPQEEDSVTRGFSSYYRNYYDEIAMSVCASMPMRGGGYIFPLRRACSSKSRQTCSQLCASAGVRKQLGGSSKHIFECLESLHIYKGRPQLAANPGRNTDVGRVGLLTYRYHSCTSSGCGPNYCCCRKGNK